MLKQSFVEQGPSGATQSSRFSDHCARQHATFKVPKRSWHQDEWGPSLYQHPLVSGMKCRGGGGGEGGGGDGGGGE